MVLLEGVVAKKVGAKFGVEGEEVVGVSVVEHLVGGVEVQLSLCECSLRD